MFSISPSTGTLTLSNIVAALRTSISAASEGGDDDRSERHRLRNRELDIAGARRKIENQVIEFAPFDCPEIAESSASPSVPQNSRRGVIEQTPSTSNASRIARLGRSCFLPLPLAVPGCRT